MSRNHMYPLSVLIVASMLVFACSKGEQSGDHRASLVGKVKPLEPNDVVELTFDNVNLVTKHDPLISAALPHGGTFSDFKVKLGSVTATIYIGYNDSEETRDEASRVLKQFDAGTFDSTNQEKVEAGQWKGHGVIEITAAGGGAYYWLFTESEHMHLFVRWTSPDDDTVAKAASLARSLLTSAKQVKQ